MNPSQPIQRRPVMMQGTTYFYPFSYFLTSAFNSLDYGRQDISGRNLHRVNVVIFSAFAVEGVVNHIGVDHIPNWIDAERKMGGWKKKLEAVAKQFNVVLDFSTSPVKSVLDAFDFRDNMAHGKTWVGDVCFLDGDGADGHSGFPDWLEQYHDLNRVETVYSDTKTVILQLLKAAGYDDYAVFQQGNGAHSQAPANTPPRNIWKLKK